MTSPPPDAILLNAIQGQMHRRAQELRGLSPYNPKAEGASGTVAELESWAKELRGIELRMRGITEPQS